jgi:peroxiredoxin
VPEPNEGVARSRLLRTGLPKGSYAPPFTLPDIEGNERELTKLTRAHVLLVLSDPNCGPCTALLPRLEALSRRTPDIQVVLVGRGTVKENKSKAAEYQLSFPILLQRRWEIATVYRIFLTPVAFLIIPQGIISSDVAIGPDAILGLLRAAAITCLLEDNVDWPPSIERRQNYFEGITRPPPNYPASAACSAFAGMSREKPHERHLLVEANGELYGSVRLSTRKGGTPNV